MAENNKPAPTTLAARLARVTAALTTLEHDGRMAQGRETYTYTSIHAIAGATRGALAAEGVVILPTGTAIVSDDEFVTKNGAQGRRVVVVMDWAITDGNETIAVQSVGEAADYSDKAFGKAQQYGRKQLLIEVLNLAMGEDPDAHKPEVGRTTRATGTSSRSRPTPARDVQDTFAKMVKAGANVGLTEADVRGIVLGAARDAAEKAGQDAAGVEVPAVLTVDAAYAAARDALASAIEKAREASAGDPYS